MGREEPEDRAHRAEISGSAAEVVQAGEVHGGVHFHGVPRPAGPTPRQLPGEARGFVNRQQEVDRLTQILTGDPEEPAAAGLLVLTGTAGVGKTSLALHWAHRVRDRFPDGQLYVNLCGYDPGPPVTAGQALDRFLRALGVPATGIPAGVEDRAALYRSLLADQRVLVLLDNAATPAQVRPLLPGTPASLAVVTSRSRLSGLVARDGAWRVPVDVLREADAVALLRKVTAGYRGQDETAELTELARLCARLPLALRIAAERAASRPHRRLTELIEDLRDESGLWDALTADNDEEADAVRTVFAWSYRALGEEAARLFRLLGLCPGGEFSDAAAAALAGASLGQARRLLDVLAGAHLLEHGADDRYRFHDLLRAYATDQAQRLESEADRLAALARLCRWYLRATDAAVAVLTPFAARAPLPEEALAVPPPRFPAERDALRWFAEERTALVAMTRLVAEHGLAEPAWRLAALLREFYQHRNMFDDWIDTARTGLAAARQLGDRAGEAESLTSLGVAYLQSGRLAESAQCHRSALELRRAGGDESGAARSVNSLGLLALRQRRLAEARARFERGLAAFEGLGERRWTAVLRANLAHACHESGAPEAANEYLTRALVDFADLGDQVGRGDALHLLAKVRRETGRLGEARAAIEAALDIARQAENQMWEAHWLLELARVQRAEGDAELALTSCRHAVTIQRQLGDHGREAEALDATGEAFRELGRPAEAVQFHQVAVVTQRRLGDRWQLARALDNLARAHAETEPPGESGPLWTEALAALADFGDPRAEALRARITARLAPGPGPTR
ncbi:MULTISPECIES: tetratricopeptide repeat protein [unclassified Crossiella]|uniref:ATP-binding protein n=1 Tax=unclassified Crossiella TaxID=2620835 RepID=UPI001FFF4318|nr:MULTISPECIES: tetratricopeptide repeat protein [unclassified Crossiella]MCK2239245.1 tetratricopeptide repeat protein [Crossiella sp. S99.2]MCK2251186.1 tetratricopeptide repeat protein [Crossiella sp. S99.1]